jgi:uncharacterized protein with GYD domain
MSTYVVRLTHTPDLCPTANAKVRERVVGGAAEIPKLAESVGVNIVTGPLVLASEHEAVAVVEADSAETVNEFVIQSGLLQWNSVRVSVAEALPVALTQIDRMPPPLF